DQFILADDALAVAQQITEKIEHLRGQRLDDAEPGAMYRRGRVISLKSCFRARWFQSVRRRWPSACTNRRTFVGLL
ncbi:hypothetical protein, partial [Bradyrhizobium sp.]|uniref:hypothetical protein n=1 Tax=Bradyrhizobium sp. TaxID=376 RepID=UPI003C60FDA0